MTRVKIGFNIMVAVTILWYIINRILLKLILLTEPDGKILWKFCIFNFGMKHLIENKNHKYNKKIIFAYLKIIHRVWWHKFSQPDRGNSQNLNWADVFALKSLYVSSDVPSQPHPSPLSELWTRCAKLPLTVHLCVLQMAVLSRKDKTGK